MNRNHFILGALFFSVSTVAATDDVENIAAAYLNAISGNGSDAGREHLLGGATMNAQIFVLENWKVVSKEPVKRETGDLAKAQKIIQELDASGKGALLKLMQQESSAQDLVMTELSQEQAQQLLVPTQKKSKQFVKQFPVLSYVIRVGKEVYWHPQNPMRAVLAKAGNKGKYEVEMHLWTVETIEGHDKTPRRWPLRILRFKGGSVDTGWKILPASDWNAE